MIGSLETLFAWVAMAALIVAIVMLFRLKRKRQEKRALEMQTAAAQAGLTPSTADAQDLKALLADFHCFSEGDIHKIDNLYSMPLDGIQLRLFDLTSESSDGEAYTETIRTIALCESGGFRFPWLLVRPKRLFSGLTKGVRLDLHTHPRLDDLYVLETADKDAARALLKEPLLQFLEHHPDKGLELRDRLIAWYPAASVTGNNKVEPEELASFIHETETLGRLLGKTK